MSPFHAEINEACNERDGDGDGEDSHGLPFYLRLT